MINELELVKACLSGDVKAQKELYNRFALPMMGMCRRYTKSTQEAEDFLQEGFFKVFTDLKQFNGKGALGGWVRKVILNSILQEKRRKKIAWVSDSELADFSPSYGSNPEIFQQLAVQDLFALMQELPDGSKMIFNLYAIEGLTHKEIAKQLDISVGTSKSQLFKAKAALQEKVLRLKLVDIT